MDSDHSLLMEPNENLTFIYTPNSPLTSQIHLKNISSSNLAFKLRTNSPSSYFVRPNQGILAPNEVKTITVILQGKDKKQDTQKDKFLILHSRTSLPSSSNLSDINEIWKSNQTQAPLFKSAKLGVIIIEQVLQVNGETGKLDNEGKNVKYEIDLDENDGSEHREGFLTPRKGNETGSMEYIEKNEKKKGNFDQPKFKFLTLMSIMGLALGVFYYVV